MFILAILIFYIYIIVENIFILCTSLYSNMPHRKFVGNMREFIK